MKYNIIYFIVDLRICYIGKYKDLFDKCLFLLGTGTLHHNINTFLIGVTIKNIDKYRLESNNRID